MVGSRFGLRSVFRDFLVAHQVIHGIGFVMHSKPVDDGGAGLIEPDYFNFGPFAAQFQHHFIERRYGGDVPEMCAGQVYTDLIKRLAESNAL